MEMNANGDVPSDNIRRLEVASGHKKTIGISSTQEK